MPMNDSEKSLYQKRDKSKEIDVLSQKEDSEPVENKSIVLEDMQPRKKGMMEENVGIIQGQGKSQKASSRKSKYNAKAFFGDITNESCWLLRAEDNRFVYELVKSTNDIDKKAALLRNASFDQLTYYWQQVDHTKNQEVLRLVFSGNITDETYAFFQGVDRDVFFQLVNCANTAAKKAALLRNASFDQLTYYWQQVDRTESQEVLRLVFSGNITDETCAFFRRLPPVDFLQLVNCANTAVEKAALLRNASFEQLTYYWHQVDHTESQEVLRLVFSGNITDETCAFFRRLPPVDFLRLVNSANIAAEKAALLKHTSFEQLRYYWNNDPDMKNPDLREKNDEVLRLVFSGNITDETRAFFRKLPPVDFLRLVNSANIAAEKAALLKHTSFEQLRYYWNNDPDIKNPNLREKNDEVLRLVFSGNITNETRAFFQSLPRIDFIRLVNSTNNLYKKAALLKNVSFGQLTYWYQKQEDPKIEEPESQKVLRALFLGNITKETRAFFRRLGAAVLRLVNSTNNPYEKAALLNNASFEQLGYYWNNDPDIKNPNVREKVLPLVFSGNSTNETCAFFQSLPCVDFIRLINSTNNPYKKAALLKNASFEQLTYWHQKQEDPKIEKPESQKVLRLVFLGHVMDETCNFLQEQDEEFVYTLINSTNNVAEKVGVLKNATDKQFRYYLECITRNLESGKEVLAELMANKNNLAFSQREWVITYIIEKIKNIKKEEFYQLFTTATDWEKGNVILLKYATLEQIEYFFEAEERIKVLNDFFERNIKRAGYLELKENIMWRADKEKNRNHENNISKFYGKDLWELLKTNMKECEEYYDNASPEEEKEKKEREKLREGYQKTLALWNLYKDRIQYEQLNFTLIDQLDGTLKNMNYNSSINGINISRTAILQENAEQRYSSLQVIFHESAHFIDYQYDKERNDREVRSKLFKKGALYKNACQDFLNMFSRTDQNNEGFLKTFEGAGKLSEQKIESIAVDKIEKKLCESGISKEEIYKEGNKFTDKFHDIADIFENIMSKVIKGSRSSLISGHGFAYWNKNDRFRYTEIFAEMFSATLSNWKSAEQIIRFFPTAYDTFLEIITSTLKDETINFLEKNPTAEELIKYIQSQAETTNSLDYLCNLCDNNELIKSKIKSIIERLDKKTCLSYFFMEKCCHSVVSSFLYGYLSEEQRNDIDKNETVIKENEISYWKNLLKDGNVTIEEFIEIYHREEHIRGSTGLWRILDDVFSTGIGYTDLGESIKRVLESASDSEMLQKLFWDENTNKKNDTFFQCMQRIFGSWIYFKMERSK